MRHSVILIPSLSQQPSLVDYVKALKREGFEHIIVVNDGSGEEYDPIFDELEEMGCMSIRHAINLGKGRALKNGFNMFLNRYAKDPVVCGIITADSDGQHTVKDVIRMDEALYRMNGGQKKGLLLGVRNFDEAQVPPKSRFGNKVTCFFFRLLYGAKLTDTQTGLRGFMRETAKAFVDSKGERFEYETMMLVEAVRQKMEIQELVIDTVYLEENKGTHFRPIKDSAMIYGILFGEFFKYTFSSLSASLIDLGIFHGLVLLFPAAWGIWLATGVARVLSSLYNYFVNRHVVFASQGGHKHSLYKYYLLCLIQGICSAALVSLLVVGLKVPKTFCKIVVDTCLFFVSYRIQQKYVFQNGGEQV